MLRAESCPQVTLVGLWTFPAAIAFHLRFWRFCAVWAAWSAAAGWLLSLCFNRRQLARSTPARVRAGRSLTHSHAHVLCQHMSLRVPCLLVRARRSAAAAVSGSSRTGLRCPFQNTSLNAFGSLHNCVQLAVTAKNYAYSAQRLWVHGVGAWLKCCETVLFGVSSFWQDRLCAVEIAEYCTSAVVRMLHSPLVLPRLLRCLHVSCMEHYVFLAVQQSGSSDALEIAFIELFLCTLFRMYTVRMG